MWKEKELCRCNGLKCRKAAWVAERDSGGTLAHLACAVISDLEEFRCKVEEIDDVIYFGKLAEAA